MVEILFFIWFIIGLIALAWVTVEVLFSCIREYDLSTILVFLLLLFIWITVIIVVKEIIGMV